VMIPIPTWRSINGSPLQIEYCGLWLEFKKPSLEKAMKGTVTDADQIKYRDYLLSQYYFHFVPFHYLQAVEVTINYLSQR